jgi:hypothetical protein
MQDGSRADSSRILPAVYGTLKGCVLALSMVWLVDRHIAAFQGALRNASLSPYANEVLSFLAHHSPL